MRLILAAIVGISLSASPAHAAAPNQQEGNAGREFIMSCTYGVLAGTLVGAASLAFTKKPGDNLNKVARGASLGLYTGILLGLYVVYVVPSMQGGEDPEQLGFLVQPMFTAQNHLDGVKADWTVLRF